MPLPPLRPRGDAFVTPDGTPVPLRGAAVGGWMNLENFINGYPGSASDLRVVLAEHLGARRASFFLDRLADHVLAEEDIAFLAAQGATALRLSLSHRAFERDDAPFRYEEAGFERLDRALDWMEGHGVYAVLDLHTAPGGQNPDWHSDNATRRALFWEHPHFQDRLVALWEALAARYAGRAVVAAYDLLNEPCTGGARGLYRYDYPSDWDALNGLYARLAEAIRRHDSDTTLLFEGDAFAARFDGLVLPDAGPVGVSAHLYTPVGFGPGPYPGTFGGERWDRDRQERLLTEHEGFRFARERDVPLFVGEFGSVFNGPPEEHPDRLRALADQLAVFAEHGVHATAWTYKDVGVMGWVTLDPESAYLRRVRPVLDAKRALGTDYWMQWLPPTEVHHRARALAEAMAAHVPGGVPHADAHRRFLMQAVLSIYGGGLLLPAFARLFEGLSEAELDDVLASFRLDRCVPNEALLDVLRSWLRGALSA